MQSFIRSGASRAHRRVKNRPVRFCRTRHRRVDMAVEKIVDSDLCKIGITVGKGDQRVLFAQSQQRRPGFRKQVDIIANFVEHSEGLINPEFPVPGSMCDFRQHGMAQEREIVDLVCMVSHDARADFPDIRLGKHLGDARVVFAQPGIQALFRPVNHRMNFPERIVQVERNCAYAIHCWVSRALNVKMIANCGERPCTEQDNEIPSHDGTCH